MKITINDEIIFKKKIMFSNQPKWPIGLKYYVRALKCSEGS